ncbi:transporter substrate-binding domain-containing protein [Rhizobium pusense]|uniref:transporter substrate-binding domain-containing protein n=1 Tax=Agrobacterium pusense TaxID=648995 RepID=UPI001FCD2B71|nr:transporter substrate-binding domain-containing protein [Agrobacterium pusense]MCJ2877454.1 transporter substrate-binding domain-containing protein [Agrobacterium pusense]
MVSGDIASAQQAPAPSGTLRATINVGNPLLGRRDDTGAISGISVDVESLLAGELKVPVHFCVFETAGNAVSAVEAGLADIGFFAHDPDRAGLIAFTEPYLLMEGCYLMREASSLQNIAEEDASGLRVTVGRGSAYDLFLSREIRHAVIERAPTSTVVFETFLHTEADVAAGVRQQLEADAARFGGSRLLPGRFMVIEQAMGVARSRGKFAVDVLANFVERMIAEGKLPVA